MRVLITLLQLVASANAHTIFTTLFINGENQGDGTCVRMPKDGETATGPVYPITGDDMACGRDGGNPVAFVCPAPSGSTLTFEFRLWPNAEHPGSIDPGHLGPCAVYVKKVDNMFSDPAEGSGWFKIWEDGYDSESGTWCVDRLVAEKGLLSIEMPSALPTGYYLVRPEILALHQAHRGDPQFYLGCAQIFIQGEGSGKLHIPAEYEASIPGYVDHDMPGVDFDIYAEPMPKYTIPGPQVYVPNPVSTSSSTAQEAKQLMGLVPSNCLVKNANWCAKPISTYSGEDECWQGVKDCYQQSKTCWSSAPASGPENCYSWSNYCKEMNAACEAKDFEGPPAFNGKEKYAAVPGSIPSPWSTEDGKDVQDDGDTERFSSIIEKMAPKMISHESSNPSEALSSKKDDIDGDCMS